MLKLNLNGRPLPASLLANIRYELGVGADEFDPVSVRWSVLLGVTVVSNGTGTVIFAPEGNQAYTIFVVATDSEGRGHEAVFSIDSITSSGAGEVSVNWTSLTYSTGEVIAATIRLYDPRGLPPSNLAWRLFRNNVQVATGTAVAIRYQTSSPGVYRIFVSAVDGNGNTVTGNSAVFVAGGFEIQASPQPLEVVPTCMYLGALYVNELTGAGGPVSELPYQLACYSEDIYLLPGTTHVSFDLDPLQNSVDDEVVVRTKLGNYAIKGYPTGLWNEDIGYDYTGGLPMLVAPADGVLSLTVEAMNVHGPVAQPFNFRVRVKCWRQRAPIYQYVKCPFSTFPGGSGKRYRQFAALFTEIEAATDVDTDLNRLGTGTAANAYATIDVSTVPLSPLRTDGAPNPVQARTGMFFTASNWFAVYEARNSEFPELDARAVSGQDGLRPYLVTLQEPDTPPIIQRIRRLKGTMALYMAQGSILAGSVIRVRIPTSKVVNGSSEVSYALTVDQTVYNNSTETFQRIGSVNVDILDWGFSNNGVTVFFDVDESGVTPPALPCADPDPVVSDPYIYSPVRAPGLLFDGACYTQPTVQPTVEGESAPGAGGITGCHEVVCGPVGVYCYTDTATGSIRINFRQPLYFPAPIVAYANDPLNCFGNPVYANEAAGTEYQAILTQQSDALCGDGWIYGQCVGTDQIVTVYPHNAAPHDVVSYGSECWSRVSVSPISGSVASSQDWTFVSAGSVTPVADCADVVCNGSNPNGSSVVYVDTQTLVSFPVEFDGMSDGVPFVGIAPQILDSGLGNLPRGELAVTFIRPRVHLFTCLERGQVDFKVGMYDLLKQIVVVRGGQVLKFVIPVGATSRFVDLEVGDVAYVDIGNRAGLLSDRTRNKRTTVSWFPVIILPRLYHTITLALTGTNSVTQLGFTGMTNRSPYTIFHALPADTQQDMPNPDNVVTVQGSGPEYVLVRTRATGDPIPPIPGPAVWYAGQDMGGTLTFRFYTSREDQGSHGEMDVWLSNQGGQFPAYFKIDNYRTFFLSGVAVRVGSNIGDVSRNSLRVTDSGSHYHWPRRYVAEDGERVTVDLISGTIVYNGKTFVAAGTDTGISSEVLTASAVVNSDTLWTTTYGDTWVTTDGLNWTL